MSTVMISSNNAYWQSQRKTGKTEKNWNCIFSMKISHDFNIYTRTDIMQEYYIRTLVADNKYRDNGVTVLEYKLTIRRTLYHPGKPTSEVLSPASFAPPFVSIEYSPHWRKPILNFPITAFHIMYPSSLTA